MTSHTCRSWTSTTPACATSASPIACGSSPSGAASRKIAPRGPHERDSPSGSSARRSAARRSGRRARSRSRGSPTAAIAVPMKAYRSVRMCWKLPSMFRLSRFAPAERHAAARLTRRRRAPRRAPARRGRGRVDQPVDRLVGDEGGEDQQRHAVGLRGEDLHAPEAERHRAARRTRGQAQRHQREADRAASVSMCPASESSASECAITPAAISTAMNATISASASREPRGRRRRDRASGGRARRDECAIATTIRPSRRRRPARPSRAASLWRARV